MFLTWLFTRVFDGVECNDEELASVREIMKTKPVVLLPCHRSHLDYLVIPYVMFLYDMVTPHIAAGVNLAFWPIGSLLRNAGAFFIRRSFRGDPLYSLCLKKYVEYLLRNRYNLMVFIEGTRSRSGKMLPPAYGMLKMALETCQKKECDDIALIPVSLCYDEVPEQGAYTKELGGEQKIKESAKELFRSRKIINRKFGKVYVKFAPPFFARDLLAKGEESNQDFTLVLQKTAFSVSKAINDSTPVTAKSIVSSIFLGHVISSLPLEEILRISEGMEEYASWAGFPLSTRGDGAFRRSVEQTVRRLQKTGILGVSETLPRSYYCDNRRRVFLNFYKNNAIHCFVIPAITMLAFFDALKNSGGEGGEVFDQSFKNRALQIRNFLKFEFFFNPTPAFLAEIDENLVYFFGEGERKGKSIPDRVSLLKDKFPDWNDLSVYLRLLGDLIESILTTSRYLSEQPSLGLDRKALTQRILKYAEGKLATGGLYFPESQSTQNYSNALSLFENQKLIVLAKENDRPVVSAQVSAKEFSEWCARLVELVQLMQERPQNILYPQTRLLLA